MDSVNSTFTDVEMADLEKYFKNMAVVIGIFMDTNADVHMLWIQRCLQMQAWSPHFEFPSKSG